MARRAPLRRPPLTAASGTGCGCSSDGVTLYGVSCALTVPLLYTLTGIRGGSLLHAVPYLGRGGGGGAWSRPCVRSQSDLSVHSRTSVYTVSSAGSLVDIW